jgi:SPP1 gp7 family putative phage head morphogenesis protein
MPKQPDFKTNFQLAPQRTAWSLSRGGKPMFKGQPLVLQVSIGDRYASTLEAAVHRMHEQLYKALKELFEHPSYAMDASDYRDQYNAEVTRIVTEYKAKEALPRLSQLFDGVGMDANIGSKARIITNQLDQMFAQMFGQVSQEAPQSMMDKLNKSSANSLQQSLKDLSGGLTFKTDFSGDRIQDVVSASVAANVDLIKSLPQDSMTNVTGAVMRSIQSGQGLADLLPFLQKQYGEDMRRARNVALDQTRKAYTSINVARMDACGLNNYEWMHTAGSQQPRPYHANVLNGTIQSIDKPPIIDPKTGERGHPGHAVNCRCTMRPVFSLDSDKD